jgi:predicted nuclease of predicted toxin-antitoxin system
MKLLLDQGLPRSAASLLRAASVDSVHVGEIGMSAASDSAILAQGQAEQRVVVTLDADFHALLALSGATAPSVIRIRREGLKAVELVTLLEKVIEALGEELALGAVVTVDENRSRMRRLPLLSTKK